MIMTIHYHSGHGITGHGPEDPDTSSDLNSLADTVHRDLEYIIDGWGDQAWGERTHVENLRRARPSNGSDPVGYAGSWESIATAALRALECQDRTEEADALRMNIRPERQHAPAYHDNPAAWEAELRRLLIDGDTYPLDTTIDGNVRYYVWECDRWECGLNEHDHGYVIPLACRTDGGNVPCACRDCFQTLCWSPMSGEAPYCHACTDADCADRGFPDCLVDPDDASTDDE